MASRTINLTDDLYDYLCAHGVRMHDAQRGLREATVGMRGEIMQIAADQGQFMGLLAELIGARRTIEIGTYTGYSALSVALALPKDGELIACDVSEEYTSVGRPFWEQAGVAHKIDLRLAPALETLDGLIADGHGGSFDFAFIDADKVNYDNYFERCLELIRPGGLIAVDNVLWDGGVIDPEKDDEDTEAIRALNKKLHADDRVTISLLPIGDGVMLARKR